MRKTSILTCTLFATALVFALPAYADTFITFSQPAAPYTTSTIDYGGGNGLGVFEGSDTLTTLGPFTFDAAMDELTVSATWGSWNTPPAVESGTPNVLYAVSDNDLTIAVSGSPTIVGFEVEPDDDVLEPISAAFYDGANLIDTISLNVNGDGGALLFALEDTTVGGSISSVVVTDDTIPDGGIALAQLRANAGTPPVPEPGTFSLLGLGMLGLAKRAYRMIKA